MAQNFNIKTVLTEMLAVMQHASAKKIMSVDEVARYLGISKSCVYKFTSQRLIPHSKVNNGKILFFDRQKVTRWALENEVPTIENLQERALKSVRGRK